MLFSLKHCFFSTTSRDELFLNLVMEYVLETLYRMLKNYSNAKQGMPLIYVKLYTYQVFELPVNKCEMCACHCATTLSQFYIGGGYSGGLRIFILFLESATRM